MIETERILVLERGEEELTGELTELKFLRFSFFDSARGPHSAGSRRRQEGAVERVPIIYLRKMIMKKARQGKALRLPILWIVLAVCIVGGISLVARNSLTSRGQSGDAKTTLRNSQTAATNERASEKTVTEGRPTSAVDFELKDLSGKSVRLSD